MSSKTGVSSISAIKVTHIILGILVSTRFKEDLYNDVTTHVRSLHECCVSILICREKVELYHEINCA